MSAGTAAVDGSTVTPPSHLIAVAGMTRPKDDRFDLEALVENFPALSEAEGGIKRLRDLVLHLAVQGALVPQLASDGTSDALIAEIGRSRHNLSTSASARVRADLDPVPTEREHPFAAPHSWRWVRLGHLGGLLGGGTPAKSNTAFWKGPIPWVSPKDMKRPYIDDAQDHISKAAVEGSAVKLIPTGSLLFVVRGMILAHSFPVALTTKEVTINQDMKALVLAIPQMAEYLLRVLWSARARVLDNVERSTHGTCRLETMVVEELMIPLPPLAEQKRIVAKVDQLMALCDDLEARQTKKRETSTRLTKSALEALTSAGGPKEFDSAWKRVLENFDVLFADSASVHDLRQTLLWTATHGLLTKRDAAEGTGAELLQRVRVGSKQRWEATTLAEMSGKTNAPPKGEAWKSKYQPPNEADTTSSLVSLLPAHWAVASLEEVAEVIDPNPSHRYPTYKNGSVPLLSTREFRGLDRWDATGSNVPMVPREVHAQQNDRCRFSRRDIIFARKGRLGLARKAPPLSEYVFSHTVFIVKVDEEIHTDYLLWFLRLDAVVTWLRRKMNDNTGVPTLGKATTERLPVPLPPAAEQERIVVSLEKLMKRCDDLEASLLRSQDRSTKLVETLARELVASELEGSESMAG